MGKRNWTSQVCDLLEEGYGVEDIGLILGVHPDSIREMVKIMRRNGILDVIFHPGRKHG